MTPDTTTIIGSVVLPNPVMTASGTAGYGAELGAYFSLDRLGAVVIKSLSAEPWPGNDAPRVRETRGGMLNAVGLQNVGVSAWIADFAPALRAAGARVVASIWGRTVDEFAAAAALLAGAGSEVVAVEVNLSCPNLEGGRHLFAHSAHETAAVVAASEVCGRPLWAKLSPNVPDIAEIAAAAVNAGAEAITLVNTVMGLALDARGSPALGAGGGGLSGPAIHPIAVRAVYQCYAALPDVAIVGVGGVAGSADAIELMQAGASAVQVGTATFADPRAPARVLAEVQRWGESHGITRIRDLIGVAHV